MGLDMYFFTASGNVTEEDMRQLEEKPDELFYFRKHSDLHGWLTEKYLETHPEEEDFNTDYLEITPEILREMQALAENGGTEEHYRGFFWGETYPEQWEMTKELCHKIQEAHDKGLKVFYYPWW